ncbi:MAG TPA: sigma-70 family RNA polymerase sigma factor [Nocardioides sp.]|nr:sigma-70 family RNA polymerase sigma factor [Nocardioides sp.]
MTTDLVTPPAAGPPYEWADHLPRLRRLCAVLAGPRDADDAAQDAVEQAWRIRHRLEDPAALGPWLDAVARNVCRRRLTRRARVDGHEELVGHSRLPDPAGPDGALEDVLEREELLDLLERALSLLPAETRSLLLARYVEERSPSEIAAVEGLSADAVSMRLARGRTRLRELLEDRFADDPAAEPWLVRHGAAWRGTRLRCRLCGSATVETRRDRGEGAVEFRCTRCEPYDVGSRYPLGNRSLGPLLIGAQRPSTVIARMATWGHAYWTDALTAGVATCTGCDGQVRPTPYRRPQVPAWAVGRGWELLCERCGTALSTSVLGLAQQHPEVRSALTAHPRMHALLDGPSRPGADPGVVFVDPADGTRVDVLLDAASLRPTRVLVDVGRARLADGS